MKILVAEDDVGIAETYLVILNAKGHGVTLTYDGAECLKVYNDALARLDDTSEEYLSLHPPFDAVVLDYRMPKMDGMDVAKLILEANKHQRIIFASAYTESTLRESVEQLHAVVELLQKPFDLELIVELIEDKRVFEELQNINVIVPELQQPDPLEELKELLQSLRKLHSKTPLIQ